MTTPDLERIVDAAESCGPCRFDSRAYTHQDIMGTLRVFQPWWELITAPYPPAVLAARPAPDTWSALEYCAHSAFIVGLHAAGLELLEAGTDVVLPPFDEDDAAFRSPAAPDATIGPAIVELGEMADLLRERYATAHSRGATNTLVVADDHPRTATSLTLHAVHDTLHHLQDVGRGFVALGAGTPHQSGRVARVSAGSGGVPKPAVAEARVGFRGLDGDRQADRRNHGRPWQALCLYSTETIDRLRAEGHPIEPGAAGENLTLTGVDFATLRPGTRLRIGEVLCETSVPALPCAKNAQWFVDGDFQRMHHARDAGATRWYASVLEEGIVRPGDEVEVESGARSEA